MKMQWLACQAWFSRDIHAHPAWFGYEGGLIQEIRDTAPENVEGIEMVPYLGPLLADPHVHVYMNPWPLDPKQRTAPGSQSFEQEVLDGTQRALQALDSGIGFIRDMGDPFGINLAVKERLASLNAPAPVLQVAGPALHRKGKYGRFLGLGFDSIEALTAQAHKLMDADEVDFIKLVGSGIVNFKKRAMNQSPQVELTTLRPLIDDIHERGFKAAVHCSGTEGLDSCIDAQIDFIEHAYFIHPEQLDRLINNRLVWSPTFAPVQAQLAPECGWDADTKGNINCILTEHRARFAEAVQNGAYGLTGTDAGSPGVSIGEGLQIEMTAMEEAGISPTRILRMASVDAAEQCTPPDYTGVLEPGHPASFCKYGKPPWDSIGNLNTLQGVISKGTEC